MKKILETNSELKKIKVTTESFNKINKGLNYKGTLLHEINHYIEGYEKYNKKSRGANLIEKDRRNNLGEIISDETKIYSEFAQEELNDIIELEQMKENPNYKSYSQELIRRNRLDFEEVELNDQKTKTIARENNKETNDTNGKKGQSNRLKLYDKELGNSSFSLDEKTRKEIVQNVSNKKVKKIRKGIYWSCFNKK